LDLETTSVPYNEPRDWDSKPVHWETSWQNIWLTSVSKKSKTDKKQDMDLFHGKSAIRTGSPTF